MKILIVYPEATRDTWGLAYFYKNAFLASNYQVETLPLKKNVTNILSRISFSIQKKISGEVISFKPDLEGIHLIEKAKQFNPQITIIIRCERLLPSTIRELNSISSLGCINIYPDHPFVIPGKGAPSLIESLKEYASVFTFSRSLVPVFYQLGACRVEWLPFAYDPKIHRILPNCEYSNSISYLGSWGSIQEKWLENLVSFSPKIYGSGWYHLNYDSQLKKYCSMEGMGPDMARVIRQSAIVFNLIRAEHGCAHSMKTFEIPACGGFMLTNWTEEQEYFFKDGIDCIFFKTTDEMLDKIKYYLSHESEREKIRQTGLETVKPHTYQRRILSLNKYLETGIMESF